MREPAKNWSVADSAKLYEVSRWGQGYFGINAAGHACVQPSRDPAQQIDIKRLIDRLQAQGVSLPVLFRFGDVLQSRLQEIHDAFATAINESGYQGGYRCVYPIKVNQQRQVVEEIVRYGRPYEFGLETGSKPELLAVVALADDRTPIVCNGFKDADYVEMAMLAHKLGRRILPVVEKYTELELILRHAERLGVRPQLGMRVKLAARGSGRWQMSAGYRSKFGLTIGELLRGLDELSARDMADCFRLLHFHLGSQVTNIQRIKAALTEAARIYVELRKRGAGLNYLDVGGGLGVDYDGSQTDFESSVNYTLQEYANDVVHYIQTVCDDAGVPHPTIVSESGRAVAAHHSVLVFNVLGVSRKGEGAEIPASVPEDFEQPLHDLCDAYGDVTSRNMLERFHDAQQALDMATSLFAGGYLPLDQRGLAENLYWAICRKIKALLGQLEYIPEDLQGLDSLLSETYFCNFSIFQSIPDSWAIGQLFPVMPVHRLQKRPDRPTVLADITCDSDGKLDRFIDRRSVKRTLPLHEFDGTPYYLAAFLVGAYQEILGDLHNLFGDTNAVHVSLNDDGGVSLDTFVPGDTVREVLRYVNFDSDALSRRMRSDVEQAVHQGKMDDQQAGQLLRFYEAGLRGYTYLEEPDVR